MFCPLCQSEFRDGFMACSDRHVDRILIALDGDQIPSHFREIVNYNWRIEIFGIPIGPRRSTFEYEVWVFRKDLERARLTARVVLIRLPGSPPPPILPLLPKFL